MTARGSRVSIPCEVHVERGRTFSPDRYHANALGLSGSSYKSEADARAKVAERIGEVVEFAIAATLNYQRHVIATQGGEVLTVEWSGAAWGYRIDGAGRHAIGAAGAWGAKTFEAAREDARRHAEQSYGGILWESK